MDKAALHWCRQRVAPVGSNRYYTLAYIPRAQRPGWLVQQALALELEAAVTLPTPPDVALHRLTWWQQQWAQPQDAHHPLLRAWRALPPEPDRPAPQQCIQLSLGYSGLLAPDTATDLETLLQRFRACGGMLWRWSARLGGCTDPDTPAWAEHAGCLIDWFYALQRLPADLQWQRESLTQDWSRQLRQAPTDTAANAVIAIAVQTLRRELTHCLARLPAPDWHHQRAMRVMLHLLRATCAEWEVCGCPLLQQRIALTPLRKWWSGWRGAREAAPHKPCTQTPE